MKNITEGVLTPVDDESEIDFLLIQDDIFTVVSVDISEVTASGFISDKTGIFRKFVSEVVVCADMFVKGVISISFVVVPVVVSIIGAGPKVKEGILSIWTGLEKFSAV